MTLQQLKEEARIEFDEKFKDKIKSENIGTETSKYYAEIVSALPETILAFIDSLITKAYEEGSKDELDKFKRIHMEIAGVDFTNDMNKLNNL